MVFSSIQFLCYFLPTVLLLVFLFPKKMSNAILLAASLFFYAYGEGIHVLVMLGLIGVDFLVGRRLAVDASDSEKPSRSTEMRRWHWLVVGVGVNLATLFLLKYANFFVENLNAALGFFHRSPIHWTPVHLPIGISFFTFQSISYLVDIYRKESTPQKNIVDLALYISLFPQLIAGPIVRYNDIAAQLCDRRSDRATRVNDFYEGAKRLIGGLAKKVLLANAFGAVADGAFALPVAQLSTAVAWLGIICYTLQIYYDFSGYSDMAIGLGKMFGFHFQENFNYPYIADSMRDFWHRWHISLSTWFRDYLYIPLGGNRFGAARTLKNLLVVFVLTGLWHGANWTFLAWGLFHGFFLVLERLAGKRGLEFLPVPVRHCYVLLVVMTAWVFFRSDNLPYAFGYLGRMFVYANPETSITFWMQNTDRQLLTTLMLGILFCTPVFSLLKDRIRNMYPVYLATARYAYVSVLLGLLFLSMAYMAAGTYNPFIYFRF